MAGQHAQHRAVDFLLVQVAFGDNSGYGAEDAAYKPAQIDTQAVVTFFFLDFRLSFSLSLMVMVRHGGEAHKAGRINSF